MEETAMIADSNTSQETAPLDPDTRLMLRVRADEPGAFEELMQRYQHRLRDVFLHFFFQPEEVEDLTQEVLLRVYRARKHYQARSKFVTWLFTIAQNLARNYRLARERHPVVPLHRRVSSQHGLRSVEQLLQAPISEPCQHIEDQELAALIRQAVARLNERQRRAVLLQAFQGMSYAEVAAVMDLTPQAVKSLLCRARDNLRVSLQPYVT
jgi:RNA polymerase sigma-70 factor (ECF subfamily)